MNPLTVGTQLTARAVLTAAGQPARADGVPQWQTSDPAVIAIEPAADGMTCKIAAKAPGTATLGMAVQAGDKLLTAAPVTLTVGLPLADAAAIAFDP